MTGEELKAARRALFYSREAMADELGINVLSVTLCEEMFTSVPQHWADTIRILQSKAGVTE